MEPKGEFLVHEGSRGKVSGLLPLHLLVHLMLNPHRARETGLRASLELGLDPKPTRGAVAVYELPPHLLIAHFNGETKHCSSQNGVRNLADGPDTLGMSPAPLHVLQHLLLSAVP